jgi:hypothetical protein
MFFIALAFGLIVARAGKGAVEPAAKEPSVAG